MVMKRGFLAGAAIAMAMLANRSGRGGGIHHILLEKVVDRTPDRPGPRSWPYCSIATWLKVTCVVTVGNGVSVGSIACSTATQRDHGGGDALLLQPTPKPSTTILYHGHFGSGAAGPRRRQDRLYAVLRPGAAGHRTRPRPRPASSTKRFNEALDAMKPWRKHLMIAHPASLFPFAPKSRKSWKRAIRLTRKADFDKVAATWRGCVTIGHSGPPPKMIDRMPKLEIIASASVGYDGIGGICAVKRHSGLQHARSARTTMSRTSPSR